MNPSIPHLNVWRMAWVVEYIEGYMLGAPPAQSDGNAGVIAVLPGRFGTRSVEAAVIGLVQMLAVTRHEKYERAVEASVVPGFRWNHYQRRSCFMVDDQALVTVIRSRVRLRSDGVLQINPKPYPRDLDPKSRSQRALVPNGSPR